MTTARDELIDVIAKAVADEFYSMLGGDPSWPEAPKPNEGDFSVAYAVLAALVSRYGEPEIVTPNPQNYYAGGSIPTQRRLVFPWQPA